MVLHCVEAQAGKMTFCSLERVSAVFGFVAPLWSVVGHKHLFVVVMAESYLHTF